MNNKKVLLVLGASSDLGVSLIENVADNYDCVIAHYRRMSEKLEELQNRYKEKLICLKADFCSEKECEIMIDDIKDKGLTPTDIVHFSSSNAEQLRFHKQSWASFQRLIDTSLKSLVQVLTAFLPAMSKQKYGRIVIMLTSYTINMPPRYLSAYVTVKYALLGLVKSLAVEYASKGITVNGVSPEMIETKFLADTPELIVKNNAEASPLGRNLVTDDVVPAIKFLLSDGAACITGQNIAITGGKF